MGRSGPYGRKWTFYGDPNSFNRRVPDPDKVGEKETYINLGRPYKGRVQKTYIKGRTS